MTDLFISYSQKDRDRIAHLVDLCQRAGWTVFWDREIPPGERYDEWIQRHLDEAKCVLVAWSHNSISSPWVRDESERARRRGVLVPLLIDDCDIPLGFGTLQTIYMTKWKVRADDPSWKQLDVRVRQLLGTEPDIHEVEDEGQAKTHKPDVYTKASVIGLCAALCLVFFISLKWGGPASPVKQDQQISSRQTNAAALYASLDQGLRTAPCAWVDLDTLSTDGGTVNLALKGVAVDVGTVQETVAKALQDKALKVGGLDTNKVAPIDGGFCTLLTEYAHIRSAGPGALSTPQIIWTMQAWPDAPNVKQARPLINFLVNADTPDVALYGLETNGAITPLITGKAQLSDPAFLRRYSITDHGNGNYQFSPNQDEAGWSGVLLIEGQGPMTQSLLAPDVAHRDAAWRQSFRATAAQRGWHADMIWLHAVAGP